MEKPLWEPNAERINSTNLKAFISSVEKKKGVHFSNFRQLYNWSIQNKGDFWSEVWSFCEMQASEPYQTPFEAAPKIQDSKWFEGAKLNFSENLLRYQDDHLAIVSCDERKRTRKLTYKQLLEQVSAVSAFLEDANVKAGDRVCGFLPNIPETIICMLATAALGAVWSSCSPDFGTKGVLDRFGQIQPKVLFALDGYYYNGKEINCISRVEELVKAIPSLEKVVIVSFLEGGDQEKHTFHRYSEIVAKSSSSKAISFSYNSFSHPLYIMYSSGTTGAPKCIVHGQGGTLIQHLKELVLHTDLKREDKILYFTTCGWMMWNWLVSSLAVGATVVLYEGSPFYPNGEALFDYIDEVGVTVFGTSAKYIAALEKEGVKPASSHQLKPLRTILSTGSPLLPESFDYVYRDIKRDLCLSSISGGTDIISCFALGNPMSPVYRGELQTRGLGMDVHVFNEKGEEVVGEKGELVCTSSFPSMPIYFWNDPDGKKYHESYFHVYPNIWRHGDYVELTERGGMIFYGRSDAVLNPGGVRIGTSELYAQVEQLEEIAESVAVGQEWQGDERVVLFVKLRQGIVLDEVLRKKICSHIRANLTPRHVPAKIIAIKDIPRTVSGKITELAIKNIIHGRPVKNTDALANPEALEQFRAISELQKD